MEYINKNPKIIIISGKARSGKSITGSMIEKHCAKRHLKSITLSYASYIKEYVKKITSWDGSDDTKPRSLLQSMGLDLLRGKINDDFLVNRMVEDIMVYSYFYDVIIINDARLKSELKVLEKTFKNVLTIRITNDNFNNNLTDKEKSHVTETDLDDYNNFDYIIKNNESVSKLNDEVNKIMKEVL